MVTTISPSNPDMDTIIAQLADIAKIDIIYDEKSNSLGFSENCDGYYPTVYLHKSALLTFIAELQEIAGKM
jgi:hypothetical protein